MIAKLTPFDRTIIYGCLLFLALGITLLAGCGAVTARKVVIGGYTAIGATSVIGRASLKQCEDKAVNDRSDAELQKCATGQAVLSKALPAAQDAAATATDTIAAYEKVKAKDYSAALAPLYDALGNLAQALAIAGIKLPVPIPTGASK